jgi:hypothetical protein
MAPAIVRYVTPTHSKAEALLARYRRRIPLRRTICDDNDFLLDKSGLRTSYEDITVWEAFSGQQAYGHGDS